MQRLLITGASGLVGSILVRQAVTQWDVTGTFQNHPIVIPGADLRRCALEKPDDIVQLIAGIRPDVIIHTAAMTDVDACERLQKQADQINTEATQRIAAEAVRAGARLIYLSTDQVFDGKKGRYDETDPAEPVNFYGMTKLSGEQAVSRAAGSHVIVRVALVYGAPLQTGNAFTEHLIGRLERGETVSLFNDQFRSPVWVENLAEALLELAAGTYSGVLQLGGPERIDRYRFGQLLAGTMGFSHEQLKPVAAQTLQFAAPRPSDVSFDIRRAQKILKTRLLAPAEGLMQMTSLKKHTKPLKNT